MQPDDRTHRLGTLGEFLTEHRSLDWAWHLFLPLEEKWTADTKGAVIDAEACDDPDHPQLAIERGLGYVMLVQSLQQIMENLEQQEADPPTRMRMVAFLHYHDHDAFIDLARSR